MNYVHIDEDVPLITDGIVIEINRKHLEQDVTFIGFTRKVPIGYGDGLETTPGVDVLGNLWDDLHAFKDQVKERVAGLFCIDTYSVELIFPVNFEDSYLISMIFCKRTKKNTSKIMAMFCQTERSTDIKIYMEGGCIMIKF